MSETINIGEIAQKLSKEIFKHFHWSVHQKTDDNFECNNSNHKGRSDIHKKTHPGDVVFYYEDPYLGKHIYLHTDLKSYKKDSISSTKLRDAFKSLCMAVECANESQAWRKMYSVDESVSHEVRGLLFVHNYDSDFDKSFYEVIDKISLQALPIAQGTVIHFLGPYDIQRMYNIGNDIIRLKSEGDLSEKYTYYYPDLVCIHRQGDVWGQAATIESITGPYLIIQHEATDSCKAGYLIYYNRPGELVEEFLYFLDTLSRYQMLESNTSIRVRVTSKDASDDLKSIFQTSKNKYIKDWGFDQVRGKIINDIRIDRITSVTNTYTPGDMGWRE